MPIQGEGCCHVGSVAARSELLLGPVFETKQRHQNREMGSAFDMCRVNSDVFPGSLNSNTDIAMIVADAVKETHSVGTAQTRSSDTAESVSDSQSVNCTTLFSLSQMNYRSNHR